jgi:ABC-2 type transport system permease protein
VPGVVVMSAISSNMWAGMGMLEEIDRGTLNRWLVTPVSRSAIMNANVAEQGISTAIQSGIIVLLGGAHYAGGVAGIPVLFVVSILLGTVFGALSNTIGMLVQQRETIIGFNTLLLLPLTFLSSALMARDLMPGWMPAAASANPVDWALRAGRGALVGQPDWSTIGTFGGLLLGLAVVPVWLSTRTFRSYQKSV